MPTLPHRRDVRSESELLHWMARHAPQRHDVVCGIGDDAAVWRVGPTHFVLATTDTIVEGVDFEPDSPPALIARKAILVNVSDIAAMGGAERLVALTTVCVPKKRGATYARRLMSALFAAAEEAGITIIGGDCSSTPGPVTLNISLLGHRSDEKFLTRTGCRPGDGIWVSGPLGGSILGRHLHPPNRLSLAKSLSDSGAVTAMIDLSDGLVIDLMRMLSPLGLGATLFAEHIPISSDARRLARRSRHSALEHALHDGEDFELCLTASHREGKVRIPPSVARSLKLVGIVHLRPGVWLFEKKGEPPREVPVKGFDHFAKATT